MTLAHSAAAITLATTDLMPPHWLHGAWGHDFAIYNPAIVRYRDRLLMAYRVDLGRGPTMQRKIGLCELNPALQIITMRVPTVLRLPPPFARAGLPKHQCCAQKMSCRANESSASIRALMGSFIPVAQSPGPLTAGWSPMGCMMNTVAYSTLTWGRRSK